MGSARTLTSLFSCVALILGATLVAAADSGSAKASYSLKQEAPECTAITTWQAAVVHGFSGYSLVAPQAHAGEPAAYTEGCSLSTFYPLRGTGSPDALNAVNPDVTVSLGAEGIKVQYSVRQTSLRAKVAYKGFSTNEDDQIVVFLANPRKPDDVVLTVSVNPLGNCSSISSVESQRFIHSQCTAANVKVISPPHSDTACPTKFCWFGTVTIPFEALRLNGLLAVNSQTQSSLLLSVGRTLWGDACKETEANRCFGVYYSVPSFQAYDSWLHMGLELRNDVSGEQYVSGAATFGNVAGTPPHRTTTTAFLPFAPGSALSGTNSDASGSVLTLRDKALGSVLPADQATAYKCVSCGSFQTDQLTTAWQPLISTKGTLGVDYAKLGIDTEPFNFDAVGYPVDSGFRFVDTQHLGSIAIAAMRGTTQKSGVAADDVLKADFPVLTGPQNLSLALTQVTASRSEAVPPITMAGLLPQPPQHSVNTEASLGYKAEWATDVTGIAGDQKDEQQTLAALLRYGSQNAPASPRLDIAFSSIWQPGYGEYATEHPIDEWAFSGGYRYLGPNWYPIDADFDPLLGLHGFYGSAQFSQPPGRDHPITASLAAHRFSDFDEPRDTSLSGAISVGLIKKLSATASFTTANLAVSQVARLTNYAGALTFGQEQQYLPNGAYAFGLAYVNAWMEANVGYSSGYAQNCGVTAAGSPGCYAYRQPSFTGGSFIHPQESPFFVDFAIQNQNNDALNLPSTEWNSQQSAWVPQQTTATHIVRKAVLGFTIPGLSCSTATFTTVNRGGDFDTFAATPPQPGFTNTYAVDIVPRKWNPSILVGYAHQGGPPPPLPPVGPAPRAQPPSQFFIRFTAGILPNAFAKELDAGCKHAP